jgi:hypothetical protein
MVKMRFALTTVLYVRTVHKIIVTNMRIGALGAPLRIALTATRLKKHAVTHIAHRNYVTNATKNVSAALNAKTECVVTMTCKIVIIVTRISVKIVTTWKVATVTLEDKAYAAIVT